MLADMKHVFQALVMVVLGSPLAVPGSGGGEFAVIAHRGASGYLPEHTAVATAMAHAMGADFIEQDVALTKDGRALVIHDVTLESTTDVARRFPDRGRKDGRFYVIDFTSEEIRQLRKGERTGRLTGKAVYPDRYPSGTYNFPLMFLGEAIGLIRGMDASRDRETGLYPELKKPEFHAAEGMDPVPPFMEALRKAGALEGTVPCHIQCFHPPTLKRIRAEYGRELSLVQLIGRNSWGESSTDYNAMLTPEGIAAVAEYADGIGLPIEAIVDASGPDLRWRPVKDWAKAHGLMIHPYTLRRETVPEGHSYEALLAFLAGADGVDGVFTDFPDIRP